MRPLLFFLSSLAAVAGCGATTTPRSRVAQDLGCTTEATGVRKITAEAPAPGLARWEVVGCGRRAIYVCTTPVRDCWREGEIQEHRSPGEDAPATP